MPATPIQPESLTLSAYQVGFGDCFLLTFHYPKHGAKVAFARHVLVDFGSSGLPKNAPAGHLLRVAKDIASECGGKLDAVVVTHRHSDHLSGFARRSDGKGTGDILRALRPDVVVQPWTEDPKAQKDALSPTAKNDPGLAAVRSLTNMQAFAAAVVEESRQLQGKLGSRRLAQLAFLGEENLTNAAAVKNLMTMGKNFYVYHGSRSGLEKVLPGVKIHVLGPPTLQQSSAIRKQRAKDEDEFWQLQAAAGRRFTAGTGPLFPGAAVYRKGQKPPPFARWLIPRMLAVRADQLLEIVRILDEQMNNTSVILLLETANRKLLFSGDAQIENWLYALKESPRAPQLGPLLADVDFYKVGHHGSGNATPKSLWALFKHRGPKSKPDRMQTVLSTKAGKHHGVPQEKLVAALKKDTTWHSTEQVKSSELKRVIGPLKL
jgi:ribonuclease BN (tRNA processing enzyme)